MYVKALTSKYFLQTVREIQVINTKKKSFNKIDGSSKRKVYLKFNSDK